MMEPEDFGTEETTEADRAYTGSRFAEVRHAIFANPYQRVWGREGEAALPIHKVTLAKALRGILSFGKPFFFRQASERIVDSHADLRWGVDGKGFSRLIHANGVCLTGRWEITEETEYSGYFRNGSQALVVARYSTCCTETLRGQRRSLALVGKLYPTTDPTHAQPLRTVSFITQEDIGGTQTRYMNDAELRNAPNVHALGRLAGVPIRLVTGLLFTRVDKEPAERQLYEIAELDKPAHEPTCCPRYIRLPVAAKQPRIRGAELDFRDEVMAQIFDWGDPEPKRSLTFNIEVTDDGTRIGFGLAQTVTLRNWRRIGRMTFDNAVISYNGDFVLHFNHPTWRADRNDPATNTRVNERRVR